jgi:hypothetical protein
MMMRDEDDTFGIRGLKPAGRVAASYVQEYPCRHCKGTGWKQNSIYSAFQDEPCQFCHGTKIQEKRWSQAMYPNSTMTAGPTVPVKIKRVKPWMIVGIVVLAMFALCGLAAALAPSPAKAPQVQPVATASGEGAQGLGAATAPDKPKPVTLAGKNVAALPIGAVLNGAFTVNYSFGSWCGIVHFLKADGSMGAGFNENVNDCAADFNTKLTGSTVVHLKNVTMVKVDNTTGPWTITFTPLGG